MSSQTTAVMLAAAQSVAKVFCIGLVGWLSVLFPTHRPLLPATAVPALARFSFLVLTMALIFGTTAQSISLATIQYYWFVTLAAFGVIAIAYTTATILAKCLLPSTRSHTKQQFTALRVAATFPNIVALPILIFPSLCNYPVVYNGYAMVRPESSATATAAHVSLRDECVANSTAMIFCYFFSWSLVFWIVGYPQLMSAATLASPTIETKVPHEHTHESTTSLSIIPGASDSPDETPRVEPSVETVVPPNDWHARCRAVRAALIQTATSPGFLALLAGVVTGCIPPLQRALFAPGGGPLSFLGDALLTLGQASSSISVMVVAASLVPERILARRALERATETNETDPALSPTGTEERPIMSDPNFGTFRRLSLHVRHSVRRHSTQWMQSMRSTTAPEQADTPNHEATRILIWFCLSSLIVAPAIVTTLLTVLDCYFDTLLATVPPLAKLVVVVNSCLPGALIVVVLLKSNPAYAHCATSVAQVYLPAYLVSIVTIAGWTTVGLYITVPDANGQTLCQR